MKDLKQTKANLLSQLKTFEDHLLGNERAMNRLGEMQKIVEGLPDSILEAGDLLVASAPTSPEISALGPVVDVSAPFLQPEPSLTTTETAGVAGEAVIFATLDTNGHDQSATA